MYLHIVWTTKHRQPILMPHLERAIFRIFNSEARKSGCTIIALNGTEDHIHALVKLGPQVSVARLINQLKGVTSLFINDQIADTSPRFQWQNGYAAFSLSKQQIPIVAKYISNQKEHHASNKLWRSLEPVPDSPQTK